MPRKSLFVKRLHLKVPVDRLRELHYSADAISSLTPPIFNMEVRGEKVVRDGELQVIVTRLGPVKISEWHARISDVGPDGFTDTAEKSPFAYFRHRHSFESEPGGCVLTDSIEFSPFFFRPLLAALFWYRHRKTQRMLTPSSS